MPAPGAARSVAPPAHGTDTAVSKAAAHAVPSAPAQSPKNVISTRPLYTVSRGGIRACVSVRSRPVARRRPGEPELVYGQIKVLCLG
jgi:hypothetical protein